MKIIKLTDIYNELILNPNILDKISTKATDTSAEDSNEVGYGCWTSKTKISIDTSELDLFFNVLDAYMSSNNLKVKDLMLGLGLLATHSGKLNSTESSINVSHFGTKEVPPGTVSSINFSRKFNLFGNAAYIPKGKIFVFTFIINGKETSVLDILLEHEAYLKKLLPDLSNTQIISILNNTKLTDSDLKKLLPELSDAQIISILDNTKLTDSEPQIVWPNSDGTFHTLTPIPSVAMVNLLKKHRDVSKEQQIYKTFTNITLGGSKPQNAGYIMSKCGKLPVLNSKISYKRKLSNIFYHPNNLYDISNLSLNRELLKILPNRKKDEYIANMAYVSVKECIHKLLSLRNIILDTEFDSPEYRYSTKSHTQSDIEYLTNKIKSLIKTDNLNMSETIVYLSSIKDALEALWFIFT